MLFKSETTEPLHSHKMPLQQGSIINGFNVIAYWCTLIVTSGSKKNTHANVPRTILSLLGERGGLGSASFFFLVATPVTLLFFNVSVPQIMTARFLVNLESPCVR